MSNFNQKVQFFLMKSPITLPTKKEKIIRHSHCQKKKKDFLFNYLNKKNGNVIAYIYIKEVIILLSNFLSIFSLFAFL